MENLSQLLSSSEFQGIGQVTADRLVDKFGEKLYDILAAKDIPLLAEVTTAAKAESLVNGWQRVEEREAVTRWLDQHKIPSSLARTVHRIWGKGSIEKLEKNPYRLLALDSWKRVDALAAKLGVGLEEPIRLIGIVEQSLYSLMDRTGSTIFTREDLVSEGIKYFPRRKNKTGNRLASTKVFWGIQLAQETNAVVAVGDSFQVPGAHFAEANVESWLLERCKVTSVIADFFGWVTQFQRKERVELADEQKDAVENALKHRVSIFHGGAGVGKTFVIRAISRLAEAQGKNPILLALAAKAARKISATTGRCAYTLARALYNFKRNDFKQSVVVIDEFSMVGLIEFRSLVKRLPPCAHLVLCGDPAQLPSIGPGRLLYSFINSQTLPTVELTTVHRQAEASGIPQFLNLIRKGEIPDELEFYDPSNPQKEGVLFLESGMEDLVDVSIAIYNQFRQGEVQIITPLSDTSVGAKAINQRIQKQDFGTEELEIGVPIVFTKNTVLDSGARVVNGQQGIVAEIVNRSPRCPDLAYISIESNDERLICTLREAESYIEPAYALTVHRGQGSDWATVVAVLPPCRLLERSMVYTALSRCKKRCVVIMPNIGVIEEAIRAKPTYETRRDNLFL